MEPQNTILAWQTDLEPSSDPLPDPPQDDQVGKTQMFWQEHNKLPATANQSPTLQQPRVNKYPSKTVTAWPNQHSVDTPTNTPVDRPAPVRHIQNTPNRQAQKTPLAQVSSPPLQHSPTPPAYAASSPPQTYPAVKAPISQDPPVPIPKHTPTLPAQNLANIPEETQKTSDDDLEDWNLEEWDRGFWARKNQIILLIPILVLGIYGTYLYITPNTSTATSENSALALKIAPDQPAPPELFSTVSFAGTQITVTGLFMRSFKALYESTKLAQIQIKGSKKHKVRKRKKKTVAVSQVDKNKIPLSWRKSDNSDIFAKEMKNVRKSVRVCWKKNGTPKQIEEIKGVKLEILVNDSGKANRVWIDKKIINTDFENCIIEQKSNWQFPEFSGGPLLLRRGISLKKKKSKSKKIQLKTKRSKS